jgi:TonB family protein
LPAGVLKRTKPTYPAQARLKKTAGTVNVFVLINRQGYVERVCSIGPKELRSSAESAAVEWRFRRPTINEGIDPFGYIQEILVFKFVLDQTLN